MTSIPEHQEIEEIRDGDNVLAIVFRKDLHADGVRFLTPETYPFQVGLIEHKDGKHVNLHRHPDRHYDVPTTQELLYVEKGQADISVTTADWKKVASVTLTNGDFILFVGGGHEIDIAKGSRLIEIKQGPYPGDSAAKIIKDQP